MWLVVDMRHTHTHTHRQNMGIGAFLQHRGRGVCAQRGHSAHMTGRNLGFLLQLAIFLPIQTILHPHNVGQPDVSPHPSIRDASVPSHRKETC